MEIGNPTINVTDLSALRHAVNNLYLKIMFKFLIVRLFL